MFRLSFSPLETMQLSILPACSLRICFWIPVRGNDDAARAKLNALSESLAAKPYRRIRTGSGSEGEVVVVNGDGESTLTGVEVAEIAKANHFFRTATSSCEAYKSAHILAAKRTMLLPLKDTREVIIATLSDQRPLSELSTALETAG